jgi:ABC-type multidrug transport system fused ATPase/permease subunit
VTGHIVAQRTSPDAVPLEPDVGRPRNWTNSSWLNGSVAYAPQQAYIIHGSIRDNILFGQPMWRERYDQCLESSMLLPDLALLQDGDLTEVGEQGVTLVSAVAVT